jgi:hypothetical protein
MHPSSQFGNISRSVKAKIDTGLGGKTSSKIREDIAPLPKGTGVQAVTQIAATNKKELEKKMKIIQVWLPSNSVIHHIVIQTSSLKCISSVCGRD